MEYTIIDVPNMNDSLSPITIDDTPYNIRFTYNDTKDYWTFGLYTDLEDPIIEGIKIVPWVVLNLFFGARKLTDGIFFCMSNQDRVGRNDFAEGKATFAFLPKEEYDE